jgi:hypothetical protein
MKVTDMLELGFRAHEVEKVEFREFEDRNWQVGVYFAEDPDVAHRLVSVHRKTARSYASLDRAVQTMKNKMRDSSVRTTFFTNYAIRPFNEREP